MARADELAALSFPIHPHMLRHSAGYKLAKDGHDTRSIQQYLGHRNITHAVRLHRVESGAAQGVLKGLSLIPNGSRCYFEGGSISAYLRCMARMCARTSSME